MRISDWSSDVCSSDLIGLRQPRRLFGHIGQARSLPVIPAKAGIHEHRLFRTGTAVFMDPRLRGGDGRLDNPLDRPRVVSGKSVSVRVDLGGRRIIKKKT